MKFPGAYTLLALCPKAPRDTPCFFCYFFHCKSSNIDIHLHMPCGSTRIRWYWVRSDITIHFPIKMRMVATFAKTCTRFPHVYSNSFAFQGRNVTFNPLKNNIYVNWKCTGASEKYLSKFLYIDMITSLRDNFSNFEKSQFIVEAFEHIFPKFEIVLFLYNFE